MPKVAKQGERQGTMEIQAGESGGDLKESTQERVRALFFPPSVRSLRPLAVKENTHSNLAQSRDRLAVGLDIGRGLNEATRCRGRKGVGRGGRCAGGSRGGDSSSRGSRGGLSLELVVVGAGLRVVVCRDEAGNEEEGEGRRRSEHAVGGG